MPKHEPLANHLRAHCGEACTLRFADIERIIGNPLPAPLLCPLARRRC